jgi:predicted nucleic acid-binding protein
MYLLGFSWRAQDALWELIDRDVVGFLALDDHDNRRARELMKKYRDLPMDLADAVLVSVAERDFQLYRPARMGRFQIVPAD